MKNLEKQPQHFGLLAGLALLAGLGVWLPLPFAAQLTAAMLLALVLPGWALLRAIRLAVADRLEQMSLAVGLSYGLTTLAALSLLYTVGGLSPVGVALTLIGLTVGLALIDWLRGLEFAPTAESVPAGGWLFFLLPVLVAAFFSLTNLGYADYWGDEMNGLLRAVSVISGRPETIFEHTKGPVEVLLPAVFGLLAGRFEPFTLRFPFALAFIVGIGGFFLLARRMFNQNVALVAALLLAINGLHLAFGRVVQYQSVVLLSSNLALLLAYHYYRHGQSQALTTSAFLVGLGLLAHYDMLLTLPPLAYLLWQHFRQQPLHRKLITVQAAVAGAILLGVAAVFYLPYFQNPQAEETSSYLTRRIAESGLLSNNFADLYLFSVMYNSRYYILFIGLLGSAYTLLDLGRILRAHRRAAWLKITVAGTAVLSLLLILLGQVTPVPLLVTLLILLLLLATDSIPTERKLLYVWVGAAFVGYVYLVDDPRTHLRIIYPGWSVLAALALFGLGAALSRRFASPAVRRAALTGAVALLAGLFLFLAYYEYLLFVDAGREYIFTYPAHKNKLYWEDPDFPFGSRRLYGAPHRLGWQMINQLFVTGQLQGDWDSNDDGSNLFWYTLGAPRNPCYPRYYFRTQFEQRESDRPPPDLAQRGYRLIGNVWQGDRLQIEVFEFDPLAAAGQPATWPEPDTYSSFVSIGDFQSWPYRDSPPTIAQPLPQPKPVFRPSPEALEQIAGQYGDPRITQVQDRAALLGYAENTTWSRPGGVLVLTLYWQAREVINLPYKIFVHLIDANGQLVAQSDQIPNCGTRPTNKWPLDQPVQDRHLLQLPPDLPAGQYSLEVGLYEPRTGRRLDFLDGLGNPQGTSYPLPPLTIPPSN